MANQHSADTLEQHQHEVCHAFARAAVAMRDAANTAENFLNWFSRVNNIQNIPMPPAFNGGVFGYGGPQYSAGQPSAAEQTSKQGKAADEADGKRKRRERKPKDPNAPRRPPSPYLLFQNEIRRNMQAQHSDVPYAQVLSEIAKLWKGMTNEERAPYKESQAVLKAKYEQEKLEYERNAGNPASVVAPEKKTGTTETPAPVITKPTASPSVSSEHSSSESSEHSSSSDEDEEVPEPEPPRKKMKKEAAKVSTPQPAKVIKKKEKLTEGKKKKTADT